MPSNNRKYTPEMREQTAKHIIESGKSATSMAEELGIDPTGMYMPGDENLNLTPEQTAAIEVLSDAWFVAQAAGDQAAMDAAHAGANDIRYGQPDIVGGLSAFPGMDAYPPYPYEVIYEAVQIKYPILSPDQVMRVANAWESMLVRLALGVTAPAMEPVVPVIEQLAHAPGAGGTGSVR